MAVFPQRCFHERAAGRPLQQTLPSLSRHSAEAFASFAQNRGMRLHTGRLGTAMRVEVGPQRLAEQDGALQTLAALHLP